MHNFSVLTIFNGNRTIYSWGVKWNKTWESFLCVRHTHITEGHVKVGSTSWCPHLKFHWQITSSLIQNRSKWNFRGFYRINEKFCRMVELLQKIGASTSKFPPTHTWGCFQGRWQSGWVFGCAWREGRGAAPPPPRTPHLPLPPNNSQQASFRRIFVPHYRHNISQRFRTCKKGTRKICSGLPTPPPPTKARKRGAILQYMGFLSVLSRFFIRSIPGRNVINFESSLWSNSKVRFWKLCGAKRDLWENNFVRIRFQGQ